MDGDPGVGTGGAVGGGLGMPTPIVDEPRPRAIGELEWKERAAEAEQELEEAQRRLAEVERELGAAKAMVQELELAQEIDAQLVRAQAVDVETARLLVQNQLGQMESPDVGRAVSEVRASKGFLFATADGMAGGVSVGRGTAHGLSASATSGLSASSAHLIDQAAEEARRSGDRRALLRYLRIRRGV